MIHRLMTAEKSQSVRIKSSIVFVEKMSNVYKIQNLEDLLQCVICLDRFQTPKVLPCQHTFCLPCLQRMCPVNQQTVTCPTCRKIARLSRGLDGLPGNILLTSLMDVQPAKARCPCCSRIETLTICEHCNCTKCTNCNEKHISDIRQSARATLDELQNTTQTDLTASIHDAFRTIRTEICNQFQSIRQQHDSVLLTKQMDVLKQLELHEQTLVKDVESDLQALEQSRAELTGKNYQLESKNEPELIDLLTKASDIQSRLAKKLDEHHAALNTIEISLQYEPERLNQIHQISDHIHLNIGKATDDKLDEQATSMIPSESICLTLRTFLNQEYKYCITSDKTISELKQLFGKQENVDPGQITLTQPGSYFDQLEDHRTLKSYGCDSATVLMICLRK